ncbi:MAG TPA: hypothetical protein P5509_08935 [Bacteroidales bacterium]|nr:hypothetical protein [Bacteroidales bacterium]
MQKLKTINSLLISILLIVFLVGACKISQQTNRYNNNATRISALPVIENQLIKLKTKIKFKKSLISGITAYKLSNDTISGVFMNEFGIKAFEFVIYEDKCIINNIIKPLDKWYIRNTIKSDFEFIFNRLSIDNTDYIIYKSRENKKCFYSYYFSKTSLSKVKRFNRNNLTGTIKILSDTSIIVENCKKNVEYNFSIINYHELRK